MPATGALVALRRRNEKLGQSACGVEASAGGQVISAVVSAARIPSEPGKPGFSAGTSRACGCWDMRKQSGSVRIGWQRRAGDANAEQGKRRARNVHTRHRHHYQGFDAAYS
ncbi:hypothetical protein VFPFJ_02434 [Purpureocillium lilacinum]|uniref:Uncharacterized protein n=1 Tax=Purpureocillium lilacinum TaxID=33203 RepID=A0A179HVA1_PURLI|nr:hypothetical protein VFPFJ_02434 [Purpureocillium lilacinum]OAQ78976.1 hypothetical protein VFPBJ_07097 [Purpureocillium lilacinum]OAQ93273.1 hypothetical protein VFPFJ_02434 [Purpureocillium lilacinum]